MEVGDMLNSVAELAELGDGAVILGVNGVAAQRTQGFGWFQAGGHQAFSDAVMAAVLPVQVLALSPSAKEIVARLSLACPDGSS